MRRIKTKIAALLTAAMIIGICPAGVNAAEIDETVIEEAVIEETVIEEQTVETAEEAGNTEEVSEEEENVKLMISGDVTSDSEVRWEFNINIGKLKIYGNGEIPSYSSASDAPWYSHITVSDVKTIVVDSGITRIGSNCFDGYSNATEVLIAEGVTSIASYAFKGCTSLVSVELPSKVERIYTGAFYGCSQLTDVTIPDGIINMAADTFKNCSSDLTLHFSDSNEYALQYCKDNGYAYEFDLIDDVDVFGMCRGIVLQECDSFLPQLYMYTLAKGYSVDKKNSYWMVDKDNNGSYETMEEAGLDKFVAGYSYQLRIQFKANEGYKFKTKTLKIGAKERTYFDGKVFCDDYDYGELYSAGSSGTVIYCNINYGKSSAIPSVTGIYVAKNDATEILAAAAVNDPNNGEYELEYCWYISKDGIPSKYLQTFSSANGNCISFNPQDYGFYGEVKLGVQVRVKDAYRYEDPYRVTLESHPFISGTCQMPDPDGNGYLIGLTSYKEAKGVYCELSILDCTLYAQGKPAWVSSTGLVEMVSGDDAKYFWTTWNPQYGYYWTLFRVYDEDKNLIDEVCYGFQNI